MNAQSHRRTAAVIGCAVSFCGAGLALAPSTAFAATSCPNKVVKVGSVGLPVKNISVQGLTCAQGYKVIAPLVAGKRLKAWKYVNASFPVATGLVPTEYTASGGRVLKYATRGG